MRGLDLYSVGSEVITFTNSSDGSVGVTKWEWTLVEVPPGSSATLSGATTATATLQADEYGSYVVSLRVNDMGDDTDGYGITVAGASYPVLHTVAAVDYGDWDPPAFHEETNSNWTDKYGTKNPYGSQRGLYKIISDLREFYIPRLFNMNSRLDFTFSEALTQRSDSSTYVDAAYMTEIDMSDYVYGTVKFVATFKAQAPGTAYVQLYDVTNSVIVTSSEISTASATVVTVWSSALTVGNAAGNMRLTPAMYKVEIKITGGVPAADYVSIYAAAIDLNA
jgi:hypothetical protein